MKTKRERGGRRSTVGFFARRALVVLGLLVVAKMVGCNGLFYLPDDRVYSEPGDHGGEVEEVFFESLDGTRLHAWLLRARGPEPALGTVIQFHGNAQNLSSHVFLSRWLTEHRLNVFVFDYRGYGRSEGSPSREGLHLDATAAIRHVRSRTDLPGPDRIVLLGQSLGGACALAAVGEGEREGVQGIAVEGTFLSYREVARDALGGSSLLWPLVWLLVSEDHSPAATIERISPIPLLVFHGDEDGVVPPRNGLAVHEAAREPKRLVSVSGGDHLDTFDSSHRREREALVEFYHEALAQPLVSRD